MATTGAWPTSVDTTLILRVVGALALLGFLRFVVKLYQVRTHVRWVAKQYNIVSLLEEAGYQ